MLQMLQRKFPNAITHKLDHGNKLGETADRSVDLIISTLTIAHIEDPEAAMQEWDRILKPGGNIIITDYHPDALQKGGKRTFRHGEKQVSIINHIHSIEKLTRIAGQLQWQPIRLEEKAIDESVRSYYEQQNALTVYKAFLGVPVIYGILFKKNDAT
jgi:ubiquinone/menaquinone biosynthesis C-methylase UbiE